MTGKEGASCQQFTDYKGDKVTLKANPDNVKDFYETGMSYINNVSVAGGGEKADFRLSFTSTNQTGVVPGSDYNKYAFSVNAGMNFTKNFTGRISAQYIPYAFLLCKNLFRHYW